MALVSDEKDDRLLPHLIGKQILTARDKNPQKNMATKRKALQIKGARFHADSVFVKTRRVCFGILPCVRITSLKKDEDMATNAISDMLRWNESPAKGQRRVVKRISCDIEGKETIQMGCVSQDSYSRKFILRELGKLGIETRRQILQRHVPPIKNWGRKGPSRGIIQKCAPHERSPCAPKFGERSNEETLHQEGCARKEAWDLAKNVYKLENSDKTTFCTPIEAKIMPALTSKRPEEREFVDDSGATIHMMSKKN